ncbi:hypothetical protein PENTCL1PPCAC_22329 [Pristionchus entomophagus]|uniref:Uncharacterized protein n=1 Tax=Pristionchus entomophagus TaxID=358040 RepID=A0AAV5U026_9BILA|nr:hypothetical protein PENTCL1PPCAC_22329 [Pristionchus entomophagus]
MGERRDNWMSDGGTTETDCSSFHSNDDTQSSIELEDAVIDIDLEKILANIPETPNTRKSVTFSFSEPYKSELPSSPFINLPPLAAIYEPSEPGTFDELKVIEFPGNVATTRTRSMSEMEGGDDHPLISGNRASISSHRPSILEDISRVDTHYMKVWIIFLLLSIILFACGLFLWPLSSSPPSFPLIQSRSSLLNDTGESTIHVNRTTRNILVTRQEIHSVLLSARYSQSFSPLGYNSFHFSHSQVRKCSEIVDENVVCCRIMDSPICHFKEGGMIRNYTLDSWTALDVENVNGRMMILKRNPARLEEFRVDYGENERRLRVVIADGHQFKTGFLQNGTVYTVFQHPERCDQIVCIENICSSVRNPVCGLEGVFPAIPSNSLVFLHCDPESEYKNGNYKQLSCTLSQVILPSMATIARSHPFQYTKPYKRDQLFYGFGDYVNTNIFHVNQLRLREDSLWEAVVSNYRLMTLS